MHGLFTYLEDNPPLHGAETRYHERSHGESFLDFVIERSQWSELRLLDEPEAALSFDGCLALVGLLRAIVADGRGQVVVSTHSPVLAAFPGALLLELDASGIQERRWEELDLVRNMRAFLAAPEQYLCGG